MEDTALLGRLLAERHHITVSAESEQMLANYAESIRPNRWSLRSALVRLAQPEPALAGEILQCVRRCDQALHGSRRMLETDTVLCDRALSPASLADSSLVDPQLPVADHPLTDVARMLAGGPELFSIFWASYQQESSRTFDEDALMLVPILGVAAQLDALADELCAWAPTAPELADVASLTAQQRAIAGALDALGIPQETGPPRR